MIKGCYVLALGFGRYNRYSRIFWHVLCRVVHCRPGLILVVFAIAEALAVRERVHCHATGHLHCLVYRLMTVLLACRCLLVPLHQLSVHIVEFVFTLQWNLAILCGHL